MVTQLGLLRKLSDILAVDFDNFATAEHRQEDVVIGIHGHATWKDFLDLSEV